ncbi:unnamed protein product [Acidithrix sp. C25]|nr:unnamed protein product [Acidithrix sp. C25]
MQVPAPVEYERALSVDDAIERLTRLGPEARLVAGGHSLLPMMKLRLARPECLIDINGLADLSFIRRDGNVLRIGAMTRHSELLASQVISEVAKIIPDAEAVIADPIVRNRGTVGGSMCQADPAEDLSAVFAALDAMVEIRGPRGTRVVSVNGFHTGPYSTVVEPDEILTEVSFVTQKNLGSAYEKVERRVGDWAIAAAGAVIALQDGKIQRAGIGLAAVGAPDFRASRAEAYLLGKDATPDLFDEAARMASAECNPNSDQRGPSAYKRHLVEVLTRRALDGALSNSKGKAN